MSAKVSALVRELPKSTIPAGHARAGGQFVFFVSGPSALQCDVGFREGDAVILSTGGNAAVHYARGRYSYSTDCWALEPVEEKIVGEFLYYYLASQVEQIDRLGFEGSGLRHLRKDFIRGYPVPKFSRSEQATIARVLSIADRAIAQTEALIAKQQRIKTGLMQDLLTRGIDEHGNLRSEQTHEFKDSPLGRIPSEWGIAHLSELARVDRGKFTHRPRDDVRFYGGPFPFIQTGDVTSHVGGIVDSYTQTLSARGVSVSKEFPRGTIAITIAANIADTAILGLPMFFPDSVVGAVVHEPNTVRFLEMAIRRWKPTLERMAPQSAQRNINLGVLRPLLIATPAADEQVRIADLYDLAAQAYEQLDHSRSKLRALRTALMQDLLTPRSRS